MDNMINKRKKHAEYMREWCKRNPDKIIIRGELL